MDDQTEILAGLWLLYKARQRRRRASVRRFWVHPVLQGRSELGELFQELREDEARFQSYFRLSRAQFDDLLIRIGGRITYRDTNYRRSISPEERLSVCLRFLATGDSYRTIASKFKVGVSTVSSIVRDVVGAIWDGLVHEFMPVPRADEWRSIAEVFKERWKFPLCCGAVAGKHILLKDSPNTGPMFLNYKGFHSVVLLAVVDAHYKFRIIDVGGYGGSLANSIFGQALTEGTLMLPPNQHLPEAEHRGPQPHVFVADEAFPLCRDLLQPFPEDGGLTPEQRIFNYRLSQAQLVAEDAFGIWSSQWRMFRSELEIYPEFVQKCVQATCVLHNFMRVSADEQVPVRGAAGASEEPLPGVEQMETNNTAREALQTREVFMAHFCEEGAVPGQPAK